MSEQMDLLEAPPAKTDDPNPHQEAISALDEMFEASQRYREFMDLMRFITRFPKYSPYNCLLLHTQNPGVSHVATVGTWAKKFRRYPKHDARPLVILA